MSVSRIRLVKRPIGVWVKASAFQSRFYSVGGEKPIPDSPPLTSRWFADLQGQLKELTDAKQPSECARQAKELYEFSQNNWLELLAGQQGFLTDKKWRGLNNHQLLWGDMVSHVNNVMYNRYVETGRVHFVRQHSEDATADEKPQWDDLTTPRSLGLILKSITTEYKFPLKFPDHITLVYKLLEEPTYESTSVKMEAWILSEQYRRVAARCIDDTVIYDYTTAKKSVLKPFMVDKLKHTFKLQQESQRKYTDEANRVIKAVEELKKQYN
ncbi:hypothetical protein KAF25_009620 [Fusarium avenaceum]|uniref:Thioesterase n=1 Tax=Fusarium avenaceum TaxID=40199 RepID=A0A9P7HC27_9HYPO|nr:hypothetical protein KAF25_009620 [Fusarium avenaceum]